ncbi:hypothetical protein [Luteibacter sp. SG786]|uniref:hypothetical protein n=1 Tax=Luteibacter sp. SG786 TaxID=2587130 RepID=UPI00141D7F58|nr:hypothetical protein [Luteibacter sp. SG786]NII54396.1 hypothetical protein [Luteibacter sp. SG786]
MATETTSQASADQEEVVALTQLTVIIDRGADIKLPTTIYEYELPILQAIYGEDLVAVVDEDDVEVPAFTANEAHDALRRKYAQNIDAVLSVFPRPSALAKSSGLDVEEDASKGKLQQSAVMDHKKATKKTAAKKTAASK